MELSAMACLCGPSCRNLNAGRLSAISNRSLLLESLRRSDRGEYSQSTSGRDEAVSGYAELGGLPSLLTSHWFWKRSTIPSQFRKFLIARTFGRSTFYAHFKSKDELLISGVHELRDTLDSAIQSERSRSKPHEDVIGFSMAMFQHASEYREVYHALLNTQGWPVFQQRLEEMFDEIIRRECKAEIQTIQRELGKDLSAMVGYVG